MITKILQNAIILVTPEKKFVITLNSKIITTKKVNIFINIKLCLILIY